MYSPRRDDEGECATVCQDPRARGIRQAEMRIAIPALERLRKGGEGQAGTESSDSSRTWKEEPQPQAATTFGLLTWKPAPVSPST